LAFFCEDVVRKMIRYSVKWIGNHTNHFNEHPSGSTQKHDNDILDPQNMANLASNNMKEC